MIFYVVLDEQQLPKPYPTRKEAREAAKRLAREFEAKHGRPALWGIVHEPKPH